MQVGHLLADNARLAAERDAYKRAKAENDERFQIEAGTLRTERDDACAERDALRAALEDLVKHAEDVCEEVSKDTLSRSSVRDGVRYYPIGGNTMFNAAMYAMSYSGTRARQALDQTQGETK